VKLSWNLGWNCPEENIYRYRAKTSAGRFDGHFPPRTISQTFPDTFLQKIIWQSSGITPEHDLPPDVPLKFFPDNLPLNMNFLKQIFPRITSGEHYTVTPRQFSQRILPKNIFSEYTSPTITPEHFPFRNSSPEIFPFPIIPKTNFLPEYSSLNVSPSRR